MNQKQKTGWLYLASFLIPMGLLIVAMIRSQVVPFGPNTLLWEDASIQYLDFFTYLRSIFAGENNIFYSFNKNLGGEMVNLVAYYLISPFNLLFAFGTDDSVPMIFTLVVVLKLCTCGLTFFHASVKRFGCKVVHLAFSTAYALMAYNVLFGCNVMWIDGVLILPLLALGLEELWKGNDPWTYCLCLCYGLLTNFYIGYMLCIASVLFSAVHLVTIGGSRSSKISGFFRFASASLVGGLGSAFVWLPAFVGVLGGRAEVDNPISSLLTFNVVKAAAKLIAGTCDPLQMKSGHPHIFCGTLVLVLVLVFFLNRKVSVKARASAFGMLAALFLSFLIRPINMVWHGFSLNYAFNFRYAFIFSYVMILVAQHSLEHIASADRRAILAVSGLIVMLIAGLAALKGILNMTQLSIVGCAVSLLALASSAGILLCSRQIRRWVCPLLVLISALEMGANCCLSWESVIPEPDFISLRTDIYEEFRDPVRDAVDYVKTLDDGFFRMEKDFFHNYNDPMSFGYNGLSHFSSAQRKNVPVFMEKMGLKNWNDSYSYYRIGSTAEVDSLLGVEYLLSQGGMAASKDYELLATVEGIQIYRNLYALPVAMVSERSVLDVSMDNENYFDLHNEIWQGISGQSRPVLTRAEYTLELENLTAIPEEDGTTRYVRDDMDQEAALRFKIPITREEPLYYYFTAPGSQDGYIHVNGQFHGYYFNDERWDMTNAGTYSQGDVVSVEIWLSSGQITLRDALFYHEDLQALAVHSSAVRNRQTEVVRQSSSHLTGSFTAEQDGQVLLFTIPYDAGWQLYIDGQKTETMEVLDALMGVTVAEGQHTFELKYTPKGAVLGCGISACALLVGGIWYTSRRKKKK